MSLRAFPLAWMLPSLLLFGSCFAGQAMLFADEAAIADAPTVEQADGQAAERGEDKYLRLVLDDDGEPISMETAVVSYVAKEGGEKPLRVDLVGAVHIGDKEYYQALNKLFTEYDVVLYELVAPEGTRIEKGAKANSRHPLGMMQGGMKDLLELEHQLEQVDYTKNNFVHADMSPADFAKSMKDRGESFLGMMFRAMGSSVAQQSKQGGPGDADILLALFSSDRALRLKRIMAHQFEDLEGAMSAISGPEGSTIIEARNDVALEGLKEQIAAGKKKIAIFYGAGHLPDMNDKLLEDFDLNRGDTRWVEAWDLTSE